MRGHCLQPIQASRTFDLGQLCVFRIRLSLLKAHVFMTSAAGLLSHMHSRNTPTLLMGDSKSAGNLVCIMSVCCSTVHSRHNRTFRVIVKDNAH